MFAAKPFVYFSEAILTPSRVVSLLKEGAASVGAAEQVDLGTLWRQAALSVRSQAALHKMPGYKGEKYHKWLSGVLDNVADGIGFPSAAARAEFKSAVLPQIGKPHTYYVPQDVRELLSTLDARNIGYGVIANESHLYAAILKSLRLAHVGPLVLAGGPDMFKPLPRMFARAVERAPAASKHDIWFVGSADVPCDNMSPSPRVRSVLVKPGLAAADPVSQHFRVPSLDCVARLVLESCGAQPGLDLAYLDERADEAAGAPPLKLGELAEADDVVLTSYPPLPPLRGQESSVAQYTKQR